MKEICALRAETYAYIMNDHSEKKKKQKEKKSM